MGSACDLNVDIGNTADTDMCVDVSIDTGVDVQVDAGCGADVGAVDLRKLRRKEERQPPAAWRQEASSCLVPPAIRLIVLSD